MRTGLILFSLILTGCDYIKDIPVGGRYIARNVCSGEFVSGMDGERFAQHYVTNILPPLKSIWQVDIDQQSQRVTVTDKLLNSTSMAIYRPPIGCVNSTPETEASLRESAPIPIPGITLSSREYWPFGSAGVDPSAAAQYDISRLKRIVDEEFEEPANGGKNTVAVLIAHNNKLIYEQYADHFGPHTPLKGFSMSKTLINALAGILYDQGVFSPEQTAQFSQWQADDRSTITLDHLLHMSSGLAHTERAIGKNNDQGQLLYGSKAPMVTALSKQLEHEPGTTFNYSSADNLLVGAWIQDQLGGTQSMYEFYQENLFHRIDIATAVLEHGSDNYALTPEALFMSARDWARFGQLYLNRGRWGDQQILSRQWIDYSFEPRDSNIAYGAFIPNNRGKHLFADLSEDVFAFYGALERFVVVIPSQNLVVVRIGFSYNRNTVDMNALVSTIADVVAE